MSLARQSVVTFATRMTIALINIPISMIIARGLGAEGQGLYSSAITFPNLWAGIGLLGLDAAHLYYLSRDRKSFGPVLANSLLILLACSAVLFPTYVLLAGRLIGEKGAAFRPYLTLSAVVVPLVIARLFFLSLFLGLGRVETYNVFLVVSQLALLAMVSLGVQVARGGTGLVIVLYQASVVLFLVLSFFWLRRVMTRGDRDRIAPSRALLGDSLSYGLRGHVGSVLTQFSYRFDTVLVLRWLGLAAQGYYSISVLLAEKLSHITASVQFVLFPRIAASSREEADRLTPMVCRHTLLWVTAAGLVLYLIGRFLLVLFYSKAYLPALDAFRVLLPGIVTLSISNVLSSDFSGRNRRGLMTLAMAFGFALNLVLNFLWIRRMGIVGAALASTLSYSAQSLLMALLFWRLTGISPLRLIVPERQDFEAYRALLTRLHDRLRGERPPADRA